MHIFVRSKICLEPCKGGRPYSPPFWTHVQENESRFKSVHGQDGKYIGYNKKQKTLDNSKLNLPEVFNHTQPTHAGQAHTQKLISA